VIEDCTFINLGGYALDLGRGAQRWRVVGNRVRDIGAGGLRIGEPGDTDPSARDACHSHQITDNEILRLGRVFAAGCGVIVFQSGTNTIAHNHIADLYYTGISVGWNWGYQETPCRANVIEFNRVERVGQGRLSDMGGFYTLGPQPGTVIRNNIFSDVQSYRYGGWALYTDEGSTGIVVENNIATRCTDAGFHQHYGRDNVIRNNLLAWNTNHSVMRTRSEPHRSFWFTTNVVLTQSGTLLGSDWSGGTNRFTSDGNLWFYRRHGTHVEAYRFSGQTWEQWRQQGHDTGSLIADPLLVDDTHPEKGLRKNSPAYSLGFRPIDVSAVGPRPKEVRRTARFSPLSRSGERFPTILDPPRPSGSLRSDRSNPAQPDLYHVRLSDRIRGHGTVPIQPSGHLCRLHGREPHLLRALPRTPGGGPRRVVPLDGQILRPMAPGPGPDLSGPGSAPELPGPRAV